MPITVLLADDSAVVRRAMSRIVESDPGIQLVGEAADLAQTIQMNNELQPHVLVMDLSMPSRESRGPEDVKSLLNLRKTYLLAVTLSSDKEAEILAERFGASILLGKECLASELVSAIKKLAAPGDP